MMTATGTMTDIPDVRPAAFWIAITTLLSLSAICLGMIIFLVS